MNEMRLIDAGELYLKISKRGSHSVEVGTSTCLAWAAAYTDVEQMIKDAPTIDAEPVRHARWESIGTGKEVNGHVIFCDGAKCTCCGQFGDGRKYCSSCGARMDEQKKEGQ